MTKTTHIASLDGLRGLAAIMVVIAHTEQMFTGMTAPLSKHLGSNGVALFFTLSGFLMAYLYAHTPLTIASGARFLVSRFARIYPVYIASVLFVAVLSAVPALGYLQPLTGSVQMLRHVLMLGSNGVFWSIGPEVQFYVLFPLFWFAFGNSTRFQTASLVLASFIAISGLLDFPGPAIFVTSKLQFFAGGVIAGHLHIKSGQDRGTAVHGLLALGLFVVFCGYQTLVPSLNRPVWDLSAAVITTLIVFCVAQQNTLSEAVFCNGALRFAGDISFSLYLFHVPVTFLVMSACRGLVPDSVAAGASFVLYVIVAVIVNRMIEKPSRRAIVGWWADRESALLALFKPQAVEATVDGPRRA